MFFVLIPSAHIRVTIFIYMGSKAPSHFLSDLTLVSFISPSYVLPWVLDTNCPRSSSENVRISTPPVSALSMALIIIPLADEGIACGPNMSTYALHHVIGHLSFIDMTARPLHLSTTLPSLSIDKPFAAILDPSFYFLNRSELVIADAQLSFIPLAMLTSHSFKGLPGLFTNPILKIWTLLFHFFDISFSIRLFFSTHSLHQIWLQVVLIKHGYHIIP